MVLLAAEGLSNAETSMMIMAFVLLAGSRGDPASPALPIVGAVDAEIPIRAVPRRGTTEPSERSPLVGAT